MADGVSVVRANGDATRALCDRQDADQTSSGSKRKRRGIDHRQAAHHAATQPRPSRRRSVSVFSIFKIRGDGLGGFPDVVHVALVMNIARA